MVSKRDQVVGLHRTAIREAAARNKARSIALMGSIARDDDTEGSDFDFLVDFDDGFTLFDIGGLQADLGELLGADVDVVPRSCMRESHRSMLEDSIVLWPAVLP